ncbi:MAG: Uncharacterised protein [Formosa sp. Hel1_33_131]|jgi:hypothetical protein|nr:MAG: Uncharacterised protein [Formosa sp. Hel1_33_131]|tara:strand:+ start:2081 stop:2272 length:192 start_codon:yes stop_codon:yes gene_type:complete
MSKTINLILGIIAVATVIYSFYGNLEPTSLFGFEINIWIYRLIWSLLAVGVFYDYAKKNKISK